MNMVSNNRQVGQFVLNGLKVYQGVVHHTIAPHQWQLEPLIPCRACLVESCFYGVYTKL